MQSVLLLIARIKQLKDAPEWKEVRGKIDQELVKECEGFDASLKGHKRQWVECKKASKGLTSDEVLKRGSAAVQVFQKVRAPSHAPEPSTHEPSPRTVSPRTRHSMRSCGGRSLALPESSCVRGGRHSGSRCSAWCGTSPKSFARKPRRLPTTTTTTKSESRRRFASRA